MMSLSLLRGPLNPDPQSDQEEHVFTYALYPHCGTWREARTMQEAADLNDRVEAVVTDAHEGDLPASHSFMSVNSPRVTLEALKRAQDTDALVVRLVERHGASGPVEVTFAGGVTAISECDLLERNDVPLAGECTSVVLEMKPFEIRTLKVLQH
jgi:alpha-mannosidase